MRKTFKTIASFAAVALSSVVNAEEVWDNGVLVLDKTNFDEAIAKYDKLLIQFYEPAW